MPEGHVLKIAAVVVTYKALGLLKQCLEGIRNQTYKVDRIIVINNGGEDETAEWLTHQDDITSVNQQNTGGAGGFHIGIKLAYEMDCDWIWCLDQDIETNSNTLSNLINSKVSNNHDTGFLSSLAFFKEKEIAHINVPLLPLSYEVINSLVINGELPILCSSFGSVLISQRAVSEAGLPIQDFFIWGDDSEYTFRMVELGFKGYLIMNSTVYHKSSINEFDPLLKIDLRSFRAKVGTRNKIYLTKLRNKLLYNSGLRAYLASFNYIMKLLKQRFKKPAGTILLDVLLIIKYFVRGLFYNPRKYLPIETRKKLKRR